MALIEKPEAAARLARTIVSDIVLYNDPSVTFYNDEGEEVKGGIRMRAPKPTAPATEDPPPPPAPSDDVPF